MLHVDNLLLVFGGAPEAFQEEVGVHILFYMKNFWVDEGTFHGDGQSYVCMTGFLRACTNPFVFVILCVVFGSPVGDLEDWE